MQINSSRYIMQISRRSRDSKRAMAIRNGAYVSDRPLIGDLVHVLMRPQLHILFLSHLIHVIMFQVTWHLTAAPNLKKTTCWKRDGIYEEVPGI